jgi:hypothetical protein
MFLFHHALNICKEVMDKRLQIGFLCENRMFRFGKLEHLVFPENTQMQIVGLNLY